MSLHYSRFSSIFSSFISVFLQSSWKRPVMAVGAQMTTPFLRRFLPGQRFSVSFVAIFVYGDEAYSCPRLSYLRASEVNFPRHHLLPELEAFSFLGLRTNLVIKIISAFQHSLDMNVCVLTINSSSLPVTSFELMKVRPRFSASIYSCCYRGNMRLY